MGTVEFHACHLHIDRRVLVAIVSDIERILQPTVLYCNDTVDVAPRYARRLCSCDRTILQAHEPIRLATAGLENLEKDMQGQWF